MRCLPISCLKASDCTVTAVPRDLEVPISDDDAASKVMHPEVACVMAGQLQELRAAMLQEGIKGFGCTAEGCGRVGCCGLGGDTDARGIVIDDGHR